QADGVYIGLGIGEYSDESGGYAQRFADERGLTLHTIDLRDEYGYDIPTAAAVTRRVPCSSCGMSKRHLIDAAALEGGYDVVATGHNLDDEAAVLLGNVLHWQTEYMGRQAPVLPARDGFPRKVKPLVRLGERETAAYCVLRGIDYIVDECPMAEGNRHLRYKEALDTIEAASPGTKHAFYFEFLDKAADRFRPEVAEAQAELRPCARCGSPTTTEVCAFCRLVERTAGAEPVPVELLRAGRGRARRRSGR
ncbi:MAG TPA: tRNA(Ile)-lysidine synthetase, partial [Acidimicrobiales bacterium]|nr:tRNA(Ile)-lysidine synthetase [Acidimicrobiales bacterium]